MHGLVHKFMNTTKNLRMLSEDIFCKEHRYNRTHIVTKLLPFIKQLTIMLLLVG